MRFLVLLGVIGIYALYMALTGNDPVMVISTEVGGAIAEVIKALALPITVPARYMAEGLYRVQVNLGPLAALVIVLAYFYFLVKRKRDPGAARFFLLTFIASVFLYRIRNLLVPRLR